jgi:hypothetical protein
LYDFDTNNIFAEPIKSMSDAEAIRAYTVLYDELTVTGLKPLFQRMDHEASSALKTFLTSREMKFQLVPSRIHIQNAAEREIQTFKNHFIAGICSKDKPTPPMGHTHHTHHHNPQPATAIKSKYEIFSVCPTQRPVRF